MTAPSRRSELGFSYIGLLILVAIMGVTLAATGELWQTTSKREKEEQLLFVGDQFRMAIQRYYNQPGAVKRFPLSLDDLLKDPRSPNTRRYLRRLYADPITGSTEWGLVRGPSGEIYGVYSRSEEEPMKQANFRLADTAFQGRKRYADWQFVYLAGQVQAGQPQPFQPQVSPLLQPITNGKP